MSREFRAVVAASDDCEGRGGFVAAAGPFDELQRRNGFKGALRTLSRGSDAQGLRITVGVGEQPDGRTLRDAAAALARELRHCATVAVTVPDIEGLPTVETARAVAEGFGLGLYRFVSHKRDPGDDALTVIELVHVDTEAINEGAGIAAAMIDATNLARDLANETPARMTASRLADVAVSLAADRGLAVDVWDEARIVEENLGLLRAVNAGSAEPARVIRLEHRPKTKAKHHIVLVGKGITFDSGGLSLKKPEWMYDMKGDMGGAAAVIAALGACAHLDVGVRVTGIIMATDNLPGPHATKPGEIIVARNGTTVEILDTDAEGRLVLADGLCLAVELEPDAIIDVATLTGYARVLGTHHTPLMSNDEDLASRVAAAATSAGERTWRLPLPEELVEALESPWADLRNIPDPDDAGTVAPGLFLRHFVGDCAWAHLDIGETGFAAKTSGATTRGCTGAMTRTLVELVRTWV